MYLLVLPGLFLTLRFVPGKDRAATDSAGGSRDAKGAGKLPARVLLYCGIAMLHMLLFFIAPTNVAMLVAERGLGSELTAGTAGTLLLVSGMIAGHVFGRLAGLIGRQTITVGYLLLAIGYVCLQGA